MLEDGGEAGDKLGAARYAREKRLSALEQVKQGMQRAQAIFDSQARPARWASGSTAIRIGNLAMTCLSCMRC